MEVPINEKRFKRKDHSRLHRVQAEELQQCEEQEERPRQT